MTEKKQLNNLDKINLENMLEQVRECEPKDVLNNVYRVFNALNKYDRKGYDVEHFKNEYDYYYKKRIRRGE